jgi:hypothetical protein
MVRSTEASRRFLHSPRPQRRTKTLSCKEFFFFSHQPKRDIELSANPLLIADMTPEQGRRLLENVALSDFTICVGTVEFQVHRAVLSVSSDFFAALFKHDYKAGHDHIEIDHH